MRQIGRMALTAFICFVSLILFTNSAKAYTYNDVNYQHWAYEDIQFIAKHGVIRGFSDGSFMPNASITRKDAAVMMTRALDLNKPKSVSVEIADIHEQTPNYNEITIAVEEGWLSLQDGQFNGSAPLTRDEMSKMLATAYSYEGKQTSVFEDVPKSDPYYLYIDGIAMHGVTTGYNDGTFRPNDHVTRAQFSAFLSRVYQKPVAYEVKSAGQTMAIVPSVEDALEKVKEYPDGTIHPQSNKFVSYPQTIATADKTNLNSGVLIYNGYKEATPGSFDPYMRYEAEDGTVHEMFDTFIILGLRYNEEGNKFIDGAENEANYEDWNNYIKRTFAENGALHKLNESALSNDREVDIYVSIPYPKRNGDIITLDGQEQVNNVYNRYDLANWYISKVLRELDKASYSNLNFKGFYWLSETVRTVEDEVLISSISSLMKRHNLYLIYSPHATSTNFYKWQNYGFDAAFLQPNAFRTGTPNKEERLHRAFLNAQIYGTGITMEIDSYGIGHADEGRGVEEFNLYMDFAKRYGLNEKGMMFYQGTNVVERMATYDHPVFKRWYDQLNETFFSEK
ncbi:DUF4855 domain-containing protein [Sporosarcina sp. HYO08]|uniref:DUF4855 domain-containing protein n=1 Tax=Sporosarcina sp. HYO08 TaxID=1759557 RepID=UPI000792155E|nr:DUF4855 domain-containing protein [Sporosarcina sp. HYO08]KXH84068.1 hypothetical protein AU377_04770 [Sporosarcina sp. HYO08]